MQKIAALAALLPLVAGHGHIASPPARKAGTAYQKACGMQPYYQQSSDQNGNIQGILQVVGTDYDPSACNLWLCKGFQLDDSSSSVQSYTAGQKVDFEIAIIAPHTGYANVSVVKTSSNSIIGSPLIEFDVYGANAGIPSNNTAFSVTLPDDLSECSTAGDCVLQWFWNAPDINQTYEGCVDFTVGGGSSGGSTDTSSAYPVPAKTSDAAADATTSAAAADATTSDAAADATTSPSAPAYTPPAAEPTTTPAAEPTDAATTPAPMYTVPTETEEAPAATTTDDCDDDDDDGDDGSDDDDCDDETSTAYSEAAYTQADITIPSKVDSGAEATSTSKAPKITANGGADYPNPGKNSGKNSKNTAVTSYVTVTAKAKTHYKTRYVTVSASAPACS